MLAEADMVPKGNGVNQSEAASCCCARTLWRFSGWPAMPMDGKVIQMQHFCHHGDTISHPVQLFKVQIYTSPDLFILKSPRFLRANIYTTIGGLSAKIDEFLAVRAQ